MEIDKYIKKGYCISIWDSAEEAEAYIEAMDFSHSPIFSVIDKYPFRDGWGVAMRVEEGYENEWSYIFDYRETIIMGHPKFEKLQ